MNTTGSASLAGVRIMCEEDKDTIDVVEARTLAGAFDYQQGRGSFLSTFGVRCSGENPALAIPSASKQASGCGADLYPLLRGSSSVYFPKYVSAIFLPPADALADEATLEILENHRVWQFLKMMAPTTGGRITVDQAQAALTTLFPDRSVDPNALAEAANRKLQGDVKTGSHVIASDSEENQFRRQEFELFCKHVHEGYPKTNLLVRPQKIETYDPIVSANFSAVALLHKLRETRAFAGFTRVRSENTQTPVERRALLTRTPKDWLPAVTVRGEGIFLVLNESRLREWNSTNQQELSQRVAFMNRSLGQLDAQQNQLDPITPRFVLLHTFAHLVINQLVFECGYGSASIRERIYCSDDGKHPMAGILLYTAAGDSEGTMGGLVRMGSAKRLEPILLRAIEKARWCSADPVCMESRGQGPDNCNLAACHACTLLPETSCEQGNRKLDRGMVVGTIENPEVGFFSNSI